MQLPFITKRVEIMRPLFRFATDRFQSLTEKSKGLIIKNEDNFNKDIGEEHPFDLTITEGIYSKFGYITGIIDKYVDFMVQDFYVISEDKKAETFIDLFMRDINFDSILRLWIKEALIKGTSYIKIDKEGDVVTGLRLLDSKFMYIKRDDFGEIISYNQIFNNKFSKEMTSFKVEEIAHLSFNTVSDRAYGLGLIYPTIGIINDVIGNFHNMAVLLERKANIPYNITVGDIEKELIPTDEELNKIRSDFEHLNNKHEWIHGPEVTISTIDFGNIGEKFESANEQQLDLLHGAMQVPAVLMGRGDIAEGLANVQMEGFMKNIRSKQAEVEKVIENKIFEPILVANNLRAHVEFEWGRPSDDENDKKATRIIDLMCVPNLDPALFKALEQDLALLMGIEFIETPEQEREKEENEPQPRLPQENESYKPLHDYFIAEGLHWCDSTYESIKSNYSLKEFIGFDYTGFKQAIKEFIRKDEFANLRGITADDFKKGKLRSNQIESLKSVLEESFDKEFSIREIEELISKKVNPSNIPSTDKDGNILLDKNGNPKVRLSSSHRSLLIARTEVIRVSAEGSLTNYSINNVEKVQWLAAISERTCPDCMALDGQVFTLNEARGKIPLHQMCRCTYVPVINTD